MGWFRRTPRAPVVEPEITTLADREAEAHAAWKTAEVILTDCCTALNRFRLTHPEHVPVKRIAGQICVQLKPDDPELIALSSAESRARFDRDVKQRAWAVLHKELHPDAVHVAGVRM